MKSPVLMIIDVQTGLFQGPPAPHDAEGVLARINNLSMRARAAGVPVLFVQHDGSPGEGLEPGSPGWQLHPLLIQEKSDLFIRKIACDSFYRSTLAETLKMLGANQILATGYATEFCVDTTVRRAASEGFDVIVVSDAHTTKDRPALAAKDIIAHHNWTLSNLVQPDNPVRVMAEGEIVF